MKLITPDELSASPIAEARDHSALPLATCPAHGFARWDGLPCPIGERQDRPTEPGIHKNAALWAVAIIALGLVIFYLAGALL